MLRAQSEYIHKNSLAFYSPGIIRNLAGEVSNFWVDLNAPVIDSWVHQEPSELLLELQNKEEEFLFMYDVLKMDYYYYHAHTLHRKDPSKKHRRPSIHAAILTQYIMNLLEIKALRIHKLVPIQ